MRLEVTRAARPSGDGIIVVDKPGGVTSHDVVSAMRRLGGTRKVGHAGTLDPLATGVLVIALGKATRLLQYLTATEKSYWTEITLGVSTDTDDREGRVLQAPGARLQCDGSGQVSLSSEQIRAAMAALTGQITQVPAQVSAVKVGGKRAHAWHREGKTVELPAREVTVSRFAMSGSPQPTQAAVSADGSLDLSAPEGTVSTVTFAADVTCSAGTYVRSLARDLGRQLGCQGIVSELRRTAVGNWTVDASWQIDELNRMVEDGQTLPLQTVEQVCAQVFEVRQVDPHQAQSLRYGNAQGIDWPAAVGQRCVAFCDGTALAVLEREPRGWRPRLVFATATEAQR